VMLRIDADMIIISSLISTYMMYVCGCTSGIDNGGRMVGIMLTSLPTYIPNTMDVPDVTTFSTPVDRVFHHARNMDDCSVALGSLASRADAQ
jgi:hypothetical protein